MESAPPRCVTTWGKADHHDGQERAKSSWPPWKCQDSTKGHEKPRCAAQRSSTSNPPFTTLAPETQTLRLQESHARSKANALDYWAQENGQVHGQSVSTVRNCARNPYKLMGQLPSLQVAAGFPLFSNTAMDMFGPLQIRLNQRTPQQAQVIIFTRATTRAVHLELVTDKSTEAFLMAFCRFACLRGHPNVCWSDRGSNFVGAQEYLREVMQNWEIAKIQSIL